MTDIVIKKFGSCMEIKDGAYPLFGFAVRDYMGQNGLKAEDVQKAYVFGAIVDESDNCNEIFNMLDVFNVYSNFALFIFDIKNTSDEFLAKLTETFEKYDEFVVLDGCYEDRIVFGRKHVEEFGCWS